MAIAVCAKEGDGEVEKNFNDAVKVFGSRGPKQKDYRLTRHACYLIAMSADGAKVEVALAKISFAVVVEQLELITAFDHEIARQIRARKGIRDNQEVDDHAFHDEVAANIFKASVARQLMRTRQVRTKDGAVAAHYDAGAMVCKLLEEAGLPTPELYATFNPAETLQEISACHCQ